VSLGKNGFGSVRFAKLALVHFVLREALVQFVLSGSRVDASKDLLAWRVDARPENCACSFFVLSQ
jgi:hypothetical protein